MAWLNLCRPGKAHGAISWQWLFTALYGVFSENYTHDSVDDIVLVTKLYSLADLSSQIYNESTNY